MKIGIDLGGTKTEAILIDNDVPYIFIQIKFLIYSPQVFIYYKFN